jgi:hypothetical protein
VEARGSSSSTPSTLSVTPSASPPPSLFEAERVFSGVRRTISWDRARLGAWIVELCELLGNWNKNDLIWVLTVVLEDEEIDVSTSSSEEEIEADEDSGDLYN